MELWRSDGTVDGTSLVRDIRLGPGGTDTLPSELTSAGGQVFFKADDGSHGEEIWRSDGTQEGTKLVRDINPRGSALDPLNTNFLTAARGMLFFAARDGPHLEELWRSDGTRAGTKLVRDTNPGRDLSGASYLTRIRRTLLFSAHGRRGVELWKVGP